MQTKSRYETDGGPGLPAGKRDEPAATGTGDGPATTGTGDGPATTGTGDGPAAVGGWQR